MLWQLHHHIPLVNLSLPRRLPDVDGDGVADLLSTCAVTLPGAVNDHRTHRRNNLVLVSGRSGAVIGRTVLLDECVDIATLNVTADIRIQFDCATSNGGR